MIDCFQNEEYDLYYEYYSYIKNISYNNTIITSIKDIAMIVHEKICKLLKELLSINYKLGDKNSSFLASTISVAFWSISESFPTFFDYNRLLRPRKTEKYVQNNSPYRLALFYRTYLLKMALISALTSIFSRRTT